MYVKLIVTTIIGLLSSRYVLLALGADDYGLYAVVGGLISLLNVLSVGMSTTTRRFINVEMGRPDGNLNRIFNISRLLHIGFAFFILIVAETIGLFYIYHFLNVSPDKLDDALFVFQCSTIAAAVSIINIPYQSLMVAYEKFAQVSIIDIISAIIKLVFVISLLSYGGNALRFYAIGISALTVITLAFYNLACFRQWRDVVKYKFYKDKKKYKEILVFNNYVALGAASYMGRTQGSTLLVNYFFGTIVNAAFAIAYTLERYCVLFVSTVGSAAAPQVTQNYGENKDRSFFLTSTLHRIAIYLMIIIVVPLTMELEFVLDIWLSKVPEGTALLCHLTLICALVRSFSGGTSEYIQASGRIKWFQITESGFELLCLPISYFLFLIGLPSFTIIIAYTICSIVVRIVLFYMMHRILSFDVKKYVSLVYPRPLLVTSLLTIAVILYRFIPITTTFSHLMGLFLGVLLTIIIVVSIGLKSDERKLIINKIFKR